jgi:hypothetical protein
MHAMMVRGWLTLPLLIWFILDFSNPLLPGAVCFDPADSVEAVRAITPAAEAPPAAVGVWSAVVRAPDVRPSWRAPHPTDRLPELPFRLAMSPRSRLTADAPPGLDDD